RRTDERWIVATRRWTLSAWMFLGIGQLLGAHWAYVEIGWGGYYAWDPVENAALMPWLAGTAYLHSVMVQEKRGMLKVWNVVLVTATFALSIFGTFLTRSGVVDSIHSFVQSPVGPALLVFLSIVLAFATTLLALAGVGPLIAWRRATPGSLWRTFRWPVISAAAGGALLALLGLGSSWPGLTAFSLCIFVTVTIGLEFARGASARRAIAGGS